MLIQYPVKHKRWLRSRKPLHFRCLTEFGKRFRVCQSFIYDHKPYDRPCYDSYSPHLKSLEVIHSNSKCDVIQGEQGNYFEKLFNSRLRIMFLQQLDSKTEIMNLNKTVTF